MWDIQKQQQTTEIMLSITVKSLFANISWTTRWIHTSKLALENAHQTISNDI